MAFLDDNDLTVPADNSAVRLGAQRIREIKAALKTFFTPTFGTSGTGVIGAGKITSAMLAVPDDTTPVTKDAPSGGDNTFNSFEVNAKGQVICAELRPLDGAELDEMSVTALALDEDAVTQRNIKDYEVTPEKLMRPERWVRFDSRERVVVLTHSGVVATGTIAIAHTHSVSPYKVGDTVTISGVAPQTAYNGTFTITDVLGNAFSYEMETDPGANAQGAPRVAVHVAACSMHLHPQYWSENIETLTRDGAGLVTVTTNSPHNFFTGDHVRIVGANNLNGVRGEFVVTVVDWLTFTYEAYGDSGNGDDGEIYMTAGLLVPDCTVVSTGGVNSGLVTITFARAFSDLNYGVLVTAGKTAAGTRCTGHVEAINVDSVDVCLIANSSNAPADCGMVTVHCIGSHEDATLIPT